MRSSMLLSLVSCLASVSHSLDFPKKEALSHPVALEKRQMTAGANILFSSPASGGTYDGVVAYPYTQQTVTFTAASSNVVLTVLVRNDPSFFQYDDFSVTAPGSTVNLVQNPGFETGSLAPWFYVGVRGLPAGGEVDTGMPHSGSYTFDDGAVGGVDGISQVIPTVAGTTYTLTFWVQSDSTIDSGTAALTQVLESDFFPPTDLSLTPATDSGSSDTDGITNVGQPIVQGNVAPSQQINVYINGTLVGNTVSLQSGTFSFPIPTTLAPGVSIITATAVIGDSESAVSEPLTVTYIPSGASSTLLLSSSSDTGIQGDGITSATSLNLKGQGPSSIVLSIYDGSTLLGTTTTDTTGAYFFTTPELALGAHSLTANEGADVAGNPQVSVPLVVTVVALATPPTLSGLTPADNSGVHGEDATTSTTPTVTGTAPPDTFVQLYSGSTLLGSATADNGGAFNLISSVLVPGVYTLTATTTDQYGDVSSPSAPLTVVINPVVPVITGISAPADSIVPNTSITTDDNVGITGTANPNVLVVLFENGNIIGSGDSDAAGAFKIATSALSIGNHTVQAETVVPGIVESALSAPFSFTILSSPSVVQSVGDCVLLGCYQEPRYARALTADNTIDYNDMSVEKCAAYCSGYSYFGVENSGECYCGNSIVTGTSQSVANNCKFVCDGHPSEFCGGWGYLDLYQCGSTTSSSTSTSSTTSSSSSSTSSSATTTSTATTSSSTSSSGLSTSSTSSSSSSSTSSSSTSSSSSTTLSFSNSTSSTSSSTSSSSSLSGSPTSSSTSRSVLFANTTLTSTSISTTSSNFIVTGVSSQAPVTTTSSSAPTGVSLTTSVVYTTIVSTIIQCPVTVMNCPADSTILTTSTIALYTTICPVAAAATANKGSLPNATPLTLIPIISSTRTGPFAGAYTTPSVLVATTYPSVASPIVASASKSVSLVSGGAQVGSASASGFVARPSSSSGSSSPKSSQLVPTNDAKSLGAGLFATIGMALLAALVM